MKNPIFIKTNVVKRTKNKNSEINIPTIYSPASVISNLDTQLKDSKEKTIWKTSKKFAK